MNYANIQVCTPDGETLAGWWISNDSRCKTIIFFHGMEGNISNTLCVVRHLFELGFNFCIVDYRGYGQSTGKPNEMGMYTDALSIWQYCLNEREKNPNDLVIWGNSLGASIACWLGKEVTCNHVVLQAPFFNLNHVFPSLFRFVSRFVFRGFNNHVNIGQISAPVTLIHSPYDNFVPIAHSKELFALINHNPKNRFIRIGGSHMRPRFDGDLLEQICDPFMKRSAIPLGYPHVENTRDINLKSVSKR